MEGAIMRKKKSCIIVGAGHRALQYASYALHHADEMEVVGVTDGAYGSGAGCLRGSAGGGQVRILTPEF
jgi:hypothetical protein